VKRITVLYEDDDCLVLNKPAGLPVQGGKKVGANLDAILTGEMKERPLLVHRLDKDTSGVILTAKNPAAAAYFSRLIAAKSARKCYRALCHDRGEEGLLAESGVIRTKLAVDGVEKDAATRYRVVRRNKEYTLFELELETGRTHQIRRHLARAGCPVLGDGKYGDFSLNKRIRKALGLKQMLLHACRLSVPLSNGALLDVTSPLPPYFEDAVARLFETPPNCVFGAL